MLHSVPGGAFPTRISQLTVHLALVLAPRNILDYFDPFFRVIVEIFVYDGGLCSMGIVIFELNWIRN